MIYCIVLYYNVLLLHVDLCGLVVARKGCTANLRTKILDFRGLDSSRILILRSGILMSIGHFPEVLSQRILVGTILVGRLGVSGAGRACARKSGAPRGRARLHPRRPRCPALRAVVSAPCSDHLRSPHLPCRLEFRQWPASVAHIAPLKIPQSVSLRKAPPQWRVILESQVSHCTVLCSITLRWYHILKCCTVVLLHAFMTNHSLLCCDSWCFVVESMKRVIPLLCKRYSLHTYHYLLLTTYSSAS